MQNFDFNYNFQALDLVRLFKDEKITQDELIYVFENAKRAFEEGGPALSDTVFVQIGYTPKKRIVLIAHTFATDSIDFIGAKVADEDDINKYYCGD